MQQYNNNNNNNIKMTTPDDNNDPPVAAEEGTTADAGGQHVVPKGVAVEELQKFRGQRHLRDKCPAPLEAMLVKQDALDIYTAMVNQIHDESKTRNWLGKWKDQEFNAVLAEFREALAEKGIKVAYCRRSSGGGCSLWLEFIDVAALEQPYVPQYDIANLSGQVIKTCYTTLTFPNGVAVEELQRHGRHKRDKLKEKAPIYVTQLMQDKDCLDEYQQLVEHLAEAGVGKAFKNWNIQKLLEIKKVHEPKFQAKGIQVYVSKKTEYISHGQYGGHFEIFRWLEFVDVQQQPNYVPQRDAAEHNLRARIGWSCKDTKSRK